MQIKLPRGLVVALALFGGLGLTAAMLSWLSPSPLAPDVSGWLFREARQGSFEPALADVQPGRWKGIYIHHSNTPGGDATTVLDASSDGGRYGPPDHFVIGNGDGLGDGVVQYTRRWVEQRPAGSPAAGARIDPAWISICVIGDMDRMPPTDLQRVRLEQLLQALQERLGISAEGVIQLDRPESSAGLGRRFAE